MPTLRPVAERGGQLQTGAASPPFTAHIEGPGTWVSVSVQMQPSERIGIRGRLPHGGGPTVGESPG